MTCCPRQEVLGTRRTRGDHGSGCFRDVPEGRGCVGGGTKVTTRAKRGDCSSARVCFSGEESAAVARGRPAARAAAVRDSASRSVRLRSTHARTLSREEEPQPVCVAIVARRALTEDAGSARCCCRWRLLSSLPRIYIHQFGLPALSPIAFLACCAYGLQ